MPLSLNSDARKNQPSWRERDLISRAAAGNLTLYLILSIPPLVL